jgi:hypothetical protein
LDWKRVFLTLGVIVLVVAGPVTASIVRGFRPPLHPQPMRFSHKAHASEAECIGCHLHADSMPSAGMPTLSACMDCHVGMQSNKPEDKQEELKLNKYAQGGKEIPWVLLPRLTSDIFFSHRRHVTVSKIKCANCHGPIEKADSAPTKRVHDLTMNWCIRCHQAKKASLDCIACHR